MDSRSGAGAGNGNGSGESEAQREARLRNLWGQLDSKNAGVLDLPALKQGLTHMNHPLKDADGMIRDMLAACDLDRDGRITYEEFRRFCNETERQLWSLFQSIDRDHNGNLDKAELSLAFEKAGVAVSNKRLDRFFSYIDKNHDGTIDFSEWRDFLLFIPADAHGLKAMMSYYNMAVKLTAEGDVHVSHEALSGLGTTVQFLKSSLFGAILQIYDPPASPPSRPRMQSSADQQPPSSTSSSSSSSSSSSLAASASEDPAAYSQHDHHPASLTYDNEDPYLPSKPARRKIHIAAPSKDLTHREISHAIATTVKTADTEGEEEEQEQEAEAEAAAATKEDEASLTWALPHLGYFVAGGLAGITSRTATAPLDRLKVYLIAQTGSASEALHAAKSGAALEATKHGARTLLRACKELWAGGGMRNLFAGNGLNIAKVVPESGVKFGAYEASKRIVAKLEGHNDPKRISGWALFTCGGLAGMFSQAVVYPLDTLKFRIQCESVPGSKTGNALLVETAKKMWRQGRIVAYYRGLPMGLIGMFPYAAIDLFTFETLKRGIVKSNMKAKGLKHEEDALPGNFSLALIGGFSGAIGASAVYPINLLRTRLQSQGTTSHPRTYTGVMDVTRQTVRGEGVRGLFKGLTPNLLKVVPAVSITYVVYENTKKALHLQ